MAQGTVKRSGAGRPRLRPNRVVGALVILVAASVVIYVVEVFDIPFHDLLMNHPVVLLTVKSTVNATLWNGLSIGSNNGGVLPLGMKNWRQITQP